MKACIVGVGSIGKRHLHNLYDILNERGEKFTIDVLRSRRTDLETNIKNMIHKEYYAFNDLPDNYDIALICNPTILHYEMIKEMVKKARNLFIEKPVFQNTGVSLEELELQQDAIYYVACPLRHKEIMKTLKTMLKQEKVLSARCICSSYLPEWRKDVDYRNVYSSKKELGGGVALDLIHEWDYLTHLFGFPQKIVKMYGKVSELSINCEDIAIYIAEYEDKFIELHLDYFGRRQQRKLEIWTNNKTIEVDVVKNSIAIYYPSGEIEKKQFMIAENYYKNEMIYFLECIEGKQQNMNDVYHAVKVLEIV